jgi:hypothetical protein
MCLSTSAVSCCLLLQAWAQLEESVGAIERANELRNFRMQERVEVVTPKSFHEPDSVFGPVLLQISTWFKRFDAAQKARDTPRFLSVVSKEGDPRTLQGEQE